MINRKRLILILIVFAVVLAFMFTSGRIYDFFGTADYIELSFQKGISYRLENYKDRMLFINNEEMKIINKSGELVFSSVTGISEPAVSVSGDYILVTDISGNTSYLYKNESLLRKYTTGGSIYCAKVNKNGYAVISTAETGYKGMFTVFSPSGKEVFKWHSGSGYIADIDISPKNNVIVSQIGTDDNFVVSRILHFNIKKNKETECAKFDNELISHLRFNDDNSFIALSDTSLTGFTSRCANKYSIDFKGRTLEYYDTSNMNNIVLAFKGSINDLIIESYSHSGKLKGSYRPSENVDSIDVNGELIVISSGRKIITVTPTGKVKTRKEIQNDISNLKVFAGRKKAVLLGGDKAMIYNIY